MQCHIQRKSCSRIVYTVNRRNCAFKNTTGQPDYYPSYNGSRYQGSTTVPKSPPTMVLPRSSPSPSHTPSPLPPAQTPFPPTIPHNSTNVAAAISNITNTLATKIAQQLWAKMADASK
eukprot:jgi/Chrzof1/13260/Cz07g26170.t1